MASHSSRPKTFLSVPRYIIDLDLPPSERWHQVVEDYKEKWKVVDEYAADMVKSVIGPTIGPAIDTIVRRVLKSFSGKLRYAQEMKAISKLSKMDLGRLVLMQHIYEACACCTSIIYNTKNGPIHIRCMDWEMDFLEALTIEAEFVKSGQTVFVATTWAGFVGVFTGMRPNGWSISLNYRATANGTFWKNLSGAIGGSWPSGFLIRHLLETTPDYATAVQTLSTTPLVAPCYLIICGIQDGEGTLITRGQTSDENRWNLGEHGTIVQVNMDHWSTDPEFDIMLSIKRRETVRRKKFPEIPDYEWFWKLMSKSPVLNDITVYATLMVPSKSILQTRLPRTGGLGYVPAKEENVLPPHKIAVPENTEIDRVRDIVLKPLPSFNCARCGVEYNIHTNQTGQCTHTGTWHSQYTDCSYAKCGWGLGVSNIGKQHWGCCFGTDENLATCKKSGLHISQLDIADEVEEIEEEPTGN